MPASRCCCRCCCAAAVCMGWEIQLSPQGIDFQWGGRKKDGRKKGRKRGRKRWRWCYTRFSFFFLHSLPLPLFRFYHMCPPIPLFFLRMHAWIESKKGRGSGQVVGGGGKRKERTIKSLSHQLLKCGVLKSSSCHNCTHWVGLNTPEKGGLA